MNNIVDSCVHTESILCPRSATCVCLSCGLVIDEGLSANNFSQRAEREDLLNADDVYILNYIRDLGCFFNTLDNVEWEAFDIFKKMQHQLFQKQTCENVKKRFQNTHLAAFAFMESRNRNGCVCSPKEIAEFTEVSVKKLWEIEKTLSFNTNAVLPSNYAPRFCAYLNLSYYHEARIASLSDNMNDANGYSPRTIICAAIKMYCDRNNIKIKIKEICNKCNVTSTSIYACIRNVVSLTDNINALYYYEIKHNE